MPTHRSIALVSALLSTGLVVACSSNDGESAAESAAAVKRAMSAPATTALTKSNGNKAFATSQSQESSGALNPFGGGSSGSGSSSTRSLATRSVRILAGGAEAGTCADILDDKTEGTCPCDGGGELDYAVSDLEAIKAGSLNGELSMTFVMKGCSIDGKKIDGKMTMIQSSKPIIDKRLWASASSSTSDDAAPGATSSELNMLWAAENLTDGSETQSFALLMQDGETCLKPTVDDGFYYVCIGGGSVGIHAKNGSFVCDFEKGECSGDGETGKILLDGSDDADSKDAGAGRADGGSSGDGMKCGDDRCQSGQICCFDEANTCADSFADCPE
ncbi:MAG: hypothetical protein KF894_20075 [Labilithrix sp.]|nr:hypothetical protein [Labilithrix sp.]